MLIEGDEVTRAIHQINKDKAIGIDNITMKPLAKRQSLQLRINGLNFAEHRIKHPRETISKKRWNTIIVEKIGE